ncbi:MAG: hypothetical protein IKS48_09020 [Eubacterium sp.]|nr:hypothetical protein [Lachnospiraceae bacterium]MBR6403508.1 hypothetical protein [Eubacterium sp.]
MSELCLKDQTVLTLKDVEGVPSDIIRIDNQELLPISLQKECTMEKLVEWLDKRSMPNTREGLDLVKEEFGEDWMRNKNHASLSDHYWLKKRTETYKRINFFDNTYSLDIGNMFFEPWVVPVNKINSNSPDLTTSGVLRKRWYQNPDNSSFLLKAESKETHQEPLSEVLVSVLCEQLQIIDAVKYDLYVEGTTMCSKCDNFITMDTDLVLASHIYYSEPKGDNESVFSHLLKMCEKFDIPGAEEFLQGVVFIDSITGNEDRNLGNIGFIRDINTMKFIGPAPLFDSANAYWNTKNVNNAVKSKLFGDVESAIFNNLKKKFNLSALSKDYGYKQLITSYPCISPTKKDNLITEISKRNMRLCNDVLNMSR